MKEWREKGRGEKMSVQYHQEIDILNILKNLEHSIKVLDHLVIFCLKALGNENTKSSIKKKKSNEKSF